MKIKFLLFSFFSLSSIGFSQTHMTFQYDEAGNQILRKAEIIQVPQAAPLVQSQPQTLASTAEETMEEKFLKGLRLYPVPVQKVLTMDWSEENDALIDQISIFEHSRMLQIFNQKNSSSLNRMIEVNLTNLYTGVYTVSFHLKNGKVISKNIIKE